jgi:hypothetical protein
VGTVVGYTNGDASNRYSFTDPTQTGDVSWYRIAMTSTSGKKYSSVIQLRNSTPEFELVNVINPFNNNLTFNINLLTSAPVAIDLLDMSGKTVLSNEKIVYSGANSISLDTKALPHGVYTLRITNKDKQVTRKVIKQ